MKIFIYNWCEYEKKEWKNESEMKIWKNFYIQSLKEEI